MRKKRGAGKINLELKSGYKSRYKAGSEQSLTLSIYMQQGEAPGGDGTMGKKLLRCLMSR